MILIGFFFAIRLLKDAFNPEEETERDWDVELRDDVKGEVESKYGKVGEIFVVKESAVRLFFLPPLSPSSVLPLAPSLYSKSA